MSTKGQCGAGRGLVHNELIAPSFLSVWMLYRMTLALLLGLEPSSWASLGAGAQRGPSQAQRPTCLTGRVGDQENGHVPALGIISHLINVCGRVCINGVS